MPIGSNVFKILLLKGIYDVTAAPCLLGVYQTHTDARRAIWIEWVAESLVGGWMAACEWHVLEKYTVYKEPDQRFVGRVMPCFFIMFWKLGRCIPTALAARVTFQSLPASAWVRKLDSTRAMAF